MTAAKVEKADAPQQTQLKTLQALRRIEMNYPGIQRQKEPGVPGLWCRAA